MAPAAKQPNVLKRKNAYELVAQDIRQRVLSGALSEGERLPPERELTEQFGVSRAVVREAIRALELSGILRVQKGAGGGTFVSAAYEKPLASTITNLLEGGAITLDHLFELRLMLEPPAAALAARTASPQGLDALAEVMEEAERVGDDSEALRAANLEFHRRLVGLTGNSLLTALCETVLQLLVDSLRGNLHIETSRAVLVFHREILGALRAGRAEEARRLTMGDLEQLWRRYREIGIM